MLRFRALSARYTDIQAVRNLSLSCHFAIFHFYCCLTRLRLREINKQVQIYEIFSRKHSRGVRKFNLSLGRVLIFFI